MTKFYTSAASAISHVDGIGMIMAAISAFQPL